MESKVRRVEEDTAPHNTRGWVPPDRRIGCSDLKKEKYMRARNRKPSSLWQMLLWLKYFCASLSLGRMSSNDSLFFKVISFVTIVFLGLGLLWVIIQCGVLEALNRTRLSSVEDSFYPFSINSKEINMTPSFQVVRYSSTKKIYFQFFFWSFSVTKHSS